MNQDASLSIATLKGGAAVEAVDLLLVDLAENILDPNTDPKAKRSIKLEVIFLPDENRETGRVQIRTEAKLAAMKPMTASVGFGRDADGLGQIAEHGIYNPNQHRLPVDGEEVPAATESKRDNNLTPLKRAQGE